MKPNQFSLKGYKEMCKKYGLSSFLDSEMMMAWQRVLEGNSYKDTKTRMENY